MQLSSDSSHDPSYRRREGDTPGAHGPGGVLDEIGAVSSDQARFDPTKCLNQDRTGSNATKTKLHRMVREDAMPFLTALRHSAIELTLEDEADTARLTRDHTQPARIAASIFAPNGQCSRKYRLIGELQQLGETAAPIWQVILDAIARSVTERWFRVEHRTHWILAARPLSRSIEQVTFAIDEQLRIVNGDLYARRQWSLSLGLPGSALPLDRIFAPVEKLSKRFPLADRVLKLHATNDGAEWVALLTPPNLLDRSDDGAVTFLHARPRFNELSAAGNPTRSSPVPKGPRLSDRVRGTIEDYIEGNLERNLSVEHLAKVLRMSPSSFSHAFHHSMSLPPHKYILWRRLLRARKLIETTDASMVEVAISSGFADQSHLCKSFQQWFGTTPSEVRRQGR